MITAAEYTTGKQPMLAITIIANGTRERVSVHPVKGKREARALALKLNAKPWNF